MPNGYPANKPVLLAAITPLYAQDMARVHGLLFRRIKDIVALRNRALARSHYGDSFAAEEVDVLNEELKEVRKMQKRFWKRLRTAQRKLQANSIGDVKP